MSPYIRKISIYFFTCLLFEIFVFLCCTPPESEFGNQLFLDLDSSSTFRLFHSYESKNISGRFPDVRTIDNWGYRGSLKQNTSAQNVTQAPNSTPPAVV